MAIQLAFGIFSFEHGCAWDSNLTVGRQFFTFSLPHSFLSLSITKRYILTVSVARPIAPFERYCCLSDMRSRRGPEREQAGDCSMATIVESYASFSVGRY